MCCLCCCLEVSWFRPFFTFEIINFEILNVYHDKLSSERWASRKIDHYFSQRNKDMSVFSVGVEVMTHSLKTSDYNGLTGTVTGPTVEKNGVTRVTVNIKLRNGSKEELRLPVQNLHLCERYSNPDPEHIILAQRGLMSAVRRSKINKIKNFVEKGADINSPDENGFTALCRAVIQGQKNMVDVLVKLGANVNARSNIPGTGHVNPVYIAAMSSSGELVRVLAEHGADVNIPVDDGATPIHVAAENGDVDVLRALIKHGANVNTPGNQGFTPICVAAEKGKVDAI